MFDIELETLYGKDTVDLVRTITDKLQSYLAARDKRVCCTSFKLNSSNVGSFDVTFSGSKPVALAGIDMMTGEYIFKSNKILKVYKLKGVDMKRIINMAESEWAASPQTKRDPAPISDFSIRF
jgi:hypothetical protein